MLGKKILSVFIITAILFPNVAYAKSINVNQSGAGATHGLDKKDLLAAKKMADSFTIDYHVKTEPRAVSGALPEKSLTEAALILYPQSISSSSKNDYAYTKSNGIVDVVNGFDKNYGIDGVARTSLKGSAIYYFENNNLNDFFVDASQWDSYRHDSSDNGEFTAVSLYFRYLFDIENDGIVGHDGNPLHNRGWWNSNGPYVTTGNWFESNIDLYDPNYPQLYTNGDLTYEWLKNCDGAGPYDDGGGTPGSYLDSIKPYLGDWFGADGGYGINHDINRSCAVFQKYEEYRKYRVKEITTNPQEYSYVYGYENQTYTDYETLANESPSAKLTIVPKYDDANAAILGYDVTASIAELKADNAYTGTGVESMATYFMRNGNLPVSEPLEGKGDIWHEIGLASVSIYEQDAQVSPENLITNIPLSSMTTLANGDKHYYLSKEKLTEVGAKDINLNKSKAVLDVAYNSKIRYMTQKVAVADEYKVNQTDSDTKTYDQIIDYINANYSGSDYVKYTGAGSDVQNFKEGANSSVGVMVYSYKTVTFPKTFKLESLITTKKLIPDPLPPTVKLTINPPNATTILEKGKFKATVDIGLISTTLDEFLLNASAPNEITYADYVGPNGELESKEWTYTEDKLKPENSFVQWHSNFKIERLEIIANNGDVIFDTNKAEDKAKLITSADDTKVWVDSLEATPYQIGEATAKVTYTYKQNQRYLLNEYSSDTIDADGKTATVTCRTYKTETSEITTGIQEQKFNIYSLSSVTNR